MRAAVCIFWSASAVLGHSTVGEWEGFKARYEKVYASVDEEAARQAVFENNVKQLDANDPTQGINKFSDLTEDEFHARYLGKRGGDIVPGANDYHWDGSCPACARFPEHANLTAAADFDWTTKGAVTPVKTQNCGDCYSFAATGDIEGSWYLAGHDLVALSEEQIIDCCFEDMSILQCAGCSGG
jgi:hypothetical protein